MRDVKRYVARAAVVAGLIVAAAACSDRPTSSGAVTQTYVEYDPSPGLFVTGALPIDPTTCAAASDASPLQTIVIDLGLVSEYEAHLRMGNRLVDQPTLGAASGLVQLSQASIVLQEADVAREAQSYSVAAAGTLQPAASGFDGEAGSGLATFALFPPTIAADYARRLTSGGEAQIDLTAQVSVSGTALDGRLASSNVFSVPVQVCWGCTVDFPSGLAERAAYCAQDPSADEAMTPTCARGQNDRTDCRACRDRAACTPCQADGECPTATRCLSTHVCG